MNGQAVCVVHGGAATRARDKAQTQLLMEKIDRQIARDYAQFERDQRRWNMWRGKETAKLTGQPLDTVTPEDVYGASIEYDRPDLMFGGPRRPGTGPQPEWELNLLRRAEQRRGLSLSHAP
jgi:hypothetical protein